MGLKSIYWLKLLVLLLLNTVSFELLAKGVDIIFAPYVWMANMNGDVKVGGASSTIDRDFYGDVLENIDDGIETYFEFRKDNWSLILDINYIKTENSRSVNSTLANIDNKTSYIDFKVGYALNINADLYLGLRNFNQDIEIDAVDNSFNLNVSDQWIDPLVGARYAYFHSPKWRVVADADIGGFRINNASDIVANITVVAIYQFDRTSHFAWGYRLMHLERDEAYQLSDTEFNVLMHGLLAGFVFKF